MLKKFLLFMALISIVAVTTFGILQVVNAEKAVKDSTKNVLDDETTSKRTIDIYSDTETTSGDIQTYDVTDDTEITETVETETISDTETTSAVPSKFSVIVRFVDDDGNQMIATRIYKYNCGAPYSIKPTTIFGYTPSMPVIVGRAENEAGSITYTIVYTKNSVSVETSQKEEYYYTLTVSFIAENEGAVAGTYEKLYMSGEHYNVECPEIEGYEAELPYVSGIITGDVDIVVVYHRDESYYTSEYYYTDVTETLEVTETSEKETTEEPIVTTPVTPPEQTYTIEIKYLYSDKTTAIESYVDSLVKGSSYSVMSPTIPGCSVDKLSVSGILNKDTTIIVTYTKNTYSVVFYNYDSSVLYKETVQYGSKITYKGATPTRPSSAEYSYSFTGWDKEISEIYSNTYYTAQYQQTKNKYTVTWKNNDGTILKTDVLEYGTLPEYGQVTPTRVSSPSDSQGGTYTFAGWSPSVVAVKSNTNYVAQYTFTQHAYTITWKNYDGTTLLTTTVAENSVPVYTGPTPSRESGQEYEYQFTGWSPSVSAAKQNAEYVAQFSSTKRKFTITWKNENGSIIYSEKLEYGATPKFNGTLPSKENTAQYTYSFEGWGVISPVTKDAAYTAQFKKTVNQYTITFKNYDGSVLQQSTYEYGATPVYNSQTPTKPSDGKNNYSFTKWSPDITSVTGNKEYIAQYKATSNSFVVTFKDYDGTILSSKVYNYGDTPSYSGTPSRPSNKEYTYTFTGWSPSVSTVIKDTVYTAQYKAAKNKYTISFYNYDGSLLQSSQVEYGIKPSYSSSTPHRDSTVQYNFIFSGWDKQLSTVTENTSYTAVFVPQTRFYTITWKDYNGSLLTTTSCAYGSTPIYPLSEPQRNAEGSTTYVFAGWSPSVSKVTGNKTYTAVYSENKKTYTITWKNYNGVVLSVESYVYGAKPTYRGETPYRDGDLSSQYVFTGWSPSVSTVTGNKTYVAQFDKERLYYTILWIDGVGNILSQEEYEYGEMPYYKGSTPTHPGNPNAKFIGWSPDIHSVDGDMDYVAQFTTETMCKVTVYLVDDWSNELAPPIVRYYKLNATYKIEASYIQGYVPLRSYVTGKVTKDISVAIIYQKDNSQETEETITTVPDITQPIETEETTQTISETTTITTTQQTETEKPDETTSQGYSKCIIIVNCVDETGALINTHTYIANKGDSFDFTKYESSTKNGYTLVSSPKIVVSSDTSIEVKYKRNTYSVVIKYQYEESNKPAPFKQQKITAQYGELIDLPVPSISGFTTSLSVPLTNNKYKVTENKTITATYTEEYRDYVVKDGNFSSFVNDVQFASMNHNYKSTFDCKITGKGFTSMTGRAIGSYTYVGKTNDFDGEILMTDMDGNTNNYDLYSGYIGGIKKTIAEKNGIGFVFDMLGGGIGNDLFFEFQQETGAQAMGVKYSITFNKNTCNKYLKTFINCINLYFDGGVKFEATDAMIAIVIKNGLITEYNIDIDGKASVYKVNIKINSTYDHYISQE